MNMRIYFDFAFTVSHPKHRLTFFIVAPLPYSTILVYFFYLLLLSGLLPSFSPHLKHMMYSSQLVASWLYIHTASFKCFY